MTGLNDTEKLIYLQDAVSDSPARFVNRGLTQTFRSYKEAIMCLKEKYDQPWLVNEERVRNTVDVVPMKNSSDKELRHLYDTAIQHY